MQLADLWQISKYGNVVWFADLFSWQIFAFGKFVGFADLICRQIIVYFGCQLLFGQPICLVGRFVQFKDLYGWKLLSFSLLNARAGLNTVSQNTKQEVGKDSHAIYVDDTMSFTETMEEHVEVLKKVFLA